MVAGSPFPRIDWTTLRQRLQTAAAASDGPAIVTDADGTLWQGDVGDDLVEAALDERFLSPSVAEPLGATAIAYGLSSWPDPHDTLRALRDAFERDLMPARAFYEMTGWMLAGKTRGELDTWCERLVRRRALASRAHPEMKRVLMWARQADVPVWVVSASPACVVRAGADLLGLPTSHVIGANMALSVDGVGLPSLDGPLPYGNDKVSLMQQALRGRHVVAAFGDNVFDWPMLETADIAVAVRPKKALLNHVPAGASLLVVDDRAG